MTLRTRLTLTVVITVLIAGVGIAAIGSWATRNELYRSAEQTMQREIDRLVNRPAFARSRLIEQFQRSDAGVGITGATGANPLGGGGRPNGAGGTSGLGPRGQLGGGQRGPGGERNPNNAPQLLPQDRSIQDLARDGNVILSVGSIVIPVDSTDIQIASSGGSRTRTLDSNGIHIMVVTESGVGGGAVQIARDLSEIDAALIRIRNIAAIICALGVALAAIIGLVMTRKAMKPVEELTDDVERRATDPDDLSPLASPGRSDEVGRLTASYNSLLASLAGSREQQRALVADASHELRTPITSLRTSIELLHRAPDLDEATRRELIANSVEELEELTHLVNEIVELAVVGSADIPFEQCELDELVKSVVIRARRRTTSEIAFTSTACSVSGRPARIERAVNNLLENAIKWSPSGAPLEVTVTGGRVTVRDRGPGIAVEDRTRVFERFARGRDAEKVAGSGLGLAIVSQVAKEHSGRAWVEAPEDGGTLAIIELPVLTSPVP
ncbi:MAG: HAMP domain-containing histidine kinase [Acidimicrobiia bacterium]|nr:HAMP domain-containing histidine kinase [Acidimicrobiia bacterium]